MHPDQHTRRRYLLLLLAALTVRVALAPFLTLALDFNTYVAWSNHLVGRPLSSFYGTIWCDYTPGYLYVLWPLGKLNAWLDLAARDTLQHIVYKLPAMLADIGTGALIHAALSRRNARLALAAAAAYVLNPAILANSTLWGQTDGITAFFALGAVFFATTAPLVACMSLAFGVLVKIQAGFIAPLLLILWIRQFGPARAAAYAGLTAFVFVLGFIPFAPDWALPSFIGHRLVAGTSQYPFTSVNAFNLWAVLHGTWAPERGYEFAVGASLTLLCWAVILRMLWRRWTDDGTRYLSAFLVFATSFFFLTRMHERHLLPALAPMVAAAALLPALWLPYGIVSVAYLTNLVYAYAWITGSFRVIIDPRAATVLTLALVALGAIAQKSRATAVKAVPVEFDWATRHRRWILAAICLFALGTRLYGLGSPPSFYFDEVYHAFSARELLRGNHDVWMWSSVPPAGFAYVWDHPPVSRLMMAASMMLFGENALAWRLPGAILGVLCVVLVYAIGRALFRNTSLSLLAAALFSLDGLPLVLSRIGMNDTYFLFFALLGVLCFLEDRHAVSALSLGLAVASKWSALLLGPVVIALFFILRKPWRASLGWFVVLPPLVYLGTYAGFFMAGHSLKEWGQLQQQMWWYHTGLKATHPYASAWWSWPFSMHPVWMYTSDGSATAARNIYAGGNPVVFLAGALAVLWAGVDAWAMRNRELLALLVLYGGLFLPWSLSPRVMFLYHYLPSVPFMCLLTAWGVTTMKHARWSAIGLLGVSIASFIHYFPAWAGR